MPSRWTTALVAGSVALVVAAPVRALAEIATRSDAKGRTITFDLQTAGVDVAAYAGVLSETLHGDEISTVTVRVIPPAAIATECGAGAAACFERDGSGARIIVPAEAATAVRDSLVHEYGHHIDSTVRHQTGQCSDGTRRWWAARGGAALLASGQLRCDYSAGWDRSLAEVFAEDYRALNVPGAVSRGALGQPGPAVLDALRQDLADLDRATPPAAPGEPVPAPDPSQPRAGGAGGLTVPVLRRGGRLTRAGRLAPREVVTIGFRLIARRRLALSVSRRGAARADFAVVLRCGRGPALIGDGRRRAAVALGGRLGPGRCTATIRAGRRGLDFGARLRVLR
jgi:hypothetical protein